MAPFIGIEQEAMSVNDPPRNNAIGTSYGGFALPFSETPNPTANKQGRTYLRPTYLPPSPFFIGQRDIVRGQHSQEQPPWPRGQHLNLMAQYKAYANNMAYYIEMMSDQNQSAPEPDQNSNNNNNRV